MKRLTAESLRSGQTIFYASRDWRSAWEKYVIRSIKVLSDKAELAPEYVMADGYPRWYLRESILSGMTSECESYSRRRVESWIKEKNRKAA